MPKQVLTFLYRISADAEYFNSRISKLEGAGDLGEHIVNVVKAKSVLGSNTATTDQKTRRLGEAEVEPVTGEYDEKEGAGDEQEDQRVAPQASGPSLNESTEGNGVVPSTPTVRNSDEAQEREVL